MTARRWLLVLLGPSALPIALWLMFAAYVWLAGEWETAGYALGWTLNLAILGSGLLLALVVPTALILGVINHFQELRARKRGWR